MATGSRFFRRSWCGPVALAVVMLAAALPSEAQNPQAAQPHRAAAKAAAGDRFTGIYTATCGADEKPGAAPAAPARRAGGGPPDRSEWYAPPQQVFDNLYWVGT